MTTRLIEIQTTDDKKVSVPYIEYQSIKVILTEILANIFACDIKNIQINFANNKPRFVLNEDYFELSGNELKDFKNQLLKLGYQTLFGKLKYAPKLTLWTQHGTALLSKIIDTDPAWIMQKKLVDFYFNAKKEAPQPQQKQEDYRQEFYNSQYQYSPMILPVHGSLAVAESVQRVLRLSESSYINMIAKICKKHDIDSDFLPEYIEQQPVSSLTKLLEDFNLTHLWTAQKLNLILEEHGILEKITRKSTKTEGKIKTFWSLTSKGLEWGKNEVYPPNPRETQPLYFRDKFMMLLKNLQIM